MTDHPDPLVVDLYHQACNAGQATRNDFIQLLSNPDMGSIVVGTCVRVLLELQDFSEDYMIAKVIGIEPGDSYSGFSQNPNQATTIHLKLQLPSRFNGGNGNLYQLNSISNSALTRHEVEVWLSLTSTEGRPDAQSFLAAGSRLRAVVPARQRRAQQQNGKSNHPQQQQLEATSRSHNAGGVGVGISTPTAALPSPVGTGPSLATSRSVTLPTGAVSSGVGKSDVVPTHLTKSRAGAGGVDGSSPNPQGRSAAKAERDQALASQSMQVTARDLVYQLILKEKSAEATLFRKNVDGMRTAELRTLERDVAEYLDRVREALANNQQRCVVCMDQIPTVIIMPCRHRVLCRWCTLKVECCPMCRGVATELFEPIEQ